jgi:cell division protein FtsB
MDLRVVRLPKRRLLSRLVESSRSLAERAPQAEAWAERVMQLFRPSLTFVYGVRRRLATTAVAGLTIWLFVHIMFGANGMVIYRQKRAEYDTLQRQIGKLQNENDRYTQQIKALQTDPKMIEKEAREQLHYVRPGEIVYVPPNPPPPPQPPSSAARK